MAARRSSSRSAAARSRSATPTRSTSRARATRSWTSSATSWPSRTARWPASAAGRWRSSASSTAPRRSRSSRSGHPTTGPTGCASRRSRSPPGAPPTRSSWTSAAGLAWIANLGCIDLNPHPVRAEDLDHPDELRVDLDPVPGVPWSQVREVALVVPRGARGGGPHRLAQDVRLAGHPRQRPDRAALDVPAGPPGGARPGPRRGAAGAGDRDVEVVEGGAPRRLPRLQPEREGPDRRLRLLRAAHPRRPRLVPAALGRGRRTAPSRTSRSRRSRRSTRSAATPGPASTGPSARWTRCWSCPHATRPRARATRPWPPNYAKQEGEPPRVQPSRKRRADADYAGRGKDGGPPPEVAEARAAAVAAGDPNAGLPTEWEGSRPSPTGRRRRASR